MSELFTTFESISPPDSVPMDALQVYLQSLDIESPTIQSSEIDYPTNFETTLKKPKITNTKEINNTNNIVSDIVSKARSLIGSNYSWGGSSTSTGFDCSGFLKYVFGSVGINLPRTAALLGKIGQEININQALPGDVIWFGSKKSPSGLHIGLVSKIENGQIYIIDAAGKKLGVTERVLPNLLIKSIRRLIGNSINSSSFSQYAINFFKSKGLPEHMAKGIVGNLIQESNGNPNAVNRKSGAYGIALWLGDRKRRLFLQYGSNPTLNLQLDFVWQELNSTENKAFQRLADTTNIADATKAFAHHFERAGKNEMNMNQRIKNAYLV